MTAKPKPFRLTALKPPVPTEYDEQAALIEWADLASRKYPELKWLHSIPNGAHTHIVTAMKLKKSGVKKGIPDLELPAARKGFHALYIEMKRIKGGRVDPEQEACHAYLRDAGYCVTVCKGWEAAKTAILDYLKG
jgi:hypothetical protein